MGLTYLERYLSGERVAVTTELTALRDELNDEALLLDARAVADEITRRCLHNLQLLHAKLTQLGYEFENPADSLVLAGPEAPESLRRIESEVGVLPLIGQAWYLRIASVDFTQVQSQLHVREEKAAEYPDYYGLGSHVCLVLQPLSKCLAHYHHHQKDHEEYARDSGDIDPLPPHLPLGTSASNNECKEFKTGERRFDTVLYNDGGGDIYFIDELRNSFKAGGFPFGEHMIRHPRMKLSWEYRANFAKLLPFLKDGLIAI
jgi:hypothetical protein